MNFAGWVTAVCGVLEYNVVSASSATPTDTEFDNVYPAAIDYAENRMQRDIDFLASQITDTTGAMVANARVQTLPTDLGTYIVTSEIRPIVAGVKQQPLEPTTRAFLDFCWPSDISPGANIVPKYWTPKDQSHIIVGPPPDQAYGFEVVGTQRFTQMSAANPTNFLSLQLPDLYVAASLVWFFGFQRDFGAQASDPQTGISWEAVYKELLSGAVTEEARKKFADMFPRASKPTGLNSQASKAA